MWTMQTPAQSLFDAMYTFTEQQLQAERQPSSRADIMCPGFHWLEALIAKNPKATLADVADALEAEVGKGEVRLGWFYSMLLMAGEQLPPEYRKRFLPTLDPAIARLLIVKTDCEWDDEELAALKEKLTRVSTDNETSDKVGAIRNG